MTVSATDSAAISATTALASSATASNTNPFVSGSAIGVSGAVSLNDVRGGATANIDQTTLTAGGGDVSVKALENSTLTASLTSEASSDGGAGTLAAGPTAASGLIATDTVLSGASATIADSGISTAGTSGQVLVRMPRIRRRSTRRW